MPKLYYNYGTMNSGKSMDLLKTAFNYEDNGNTVLVFKSVVDTRDGAFVKSRGGGREVPAILVDEQSGSMMYEMTKERKPAVVLVDEAQFMTADQIDELVRIVDELNIPVLAYGLMTDFRGSLFPGSQRLIEVGARLNLIKMVCRYCSRAAVYNMRHVDGVPVFSGEQVQVGGNESYKAVCRHCYAKAKKGIKLEGVVSHV